MMAIVLRWLAILGGLAVALSFGDLAAGYLVFKYYVNKDGGVRIYERPAVSGYLVGDARPGCTGGCLLDVVRMTYAYREYFISDPWPSSLHVGTGYQHFYVTSNADPYCQAFRDYKLRETVHESYGLPRDRCIAVRATEQPISRYRVDMTALARESTAPLFFRISVSKQSITEIATGKVIAESATYIYEPRLPFAAIRASALLPTREILTPEEGLTP